MIQMHGKSGKDGSFGRNAVWDFREGHVCVPPPYSAVARGYLKSAPWLVSRDCAVIEGQSSLLCAVEMQGLLANFASAFRQDSGLASSHHEARFRSFFLTEILISCIRRAECQKPIAEGCGKTSRPARSGHPLNPNARTLSRSKAAACRPETSRPETGRKTPQWGQRSCAPSSTGPGTGTGVPQVGRGGRMVGEAVRENARSISAAGFPGWHIRRPCPRWTYPGHAACGHPGSRAPLAGGGGRSADPLHGRGHAAASPLAF